MLRRYLCDKCGCRYPEPGDCPNCNEVLVDLHDPEALRFLEAIDDRRMNKRRAVFAALVGVPVLGLVALIWLAILNAGYIVVPGIGLFAAGGAGIMVMVGAASEALARAMPPKKVMPADVAAP